jgi:hypothetical protein
MITEHKFKQEININSRWITLRISTTIPISHYLIRVIRVTEESIYYLYDDDDKMEFRMGYELFLEHFKPI